MDETAAPMPSIGADANDDMHVDEQAENEGEEEGDEEEDEEEDEDGKEDKAFATKIDVNLADMSS